MRVLQRVAVTAALLLALQTMTNFAAVASPPVVEADNSLTNGAIEGAVVDSPTNSSAVVELKNRHGFWTNLYVQQPAGQAELIAHPSLDLIPVPNRPFA